MLAGVPAVLRARLTHVSARGDGPCLTWRETRKAPDEGRSDRSECDQAAFLCPLRMGDFGSTFRGCLRILLMGCDSRGPHLDSGPADPLASQRRSVGEHRSPSVSPGGRRTTVSADSDLSRSRKERVCSRAHTRGYPPLASVKCLASHLRRRRAFAEALRGRIRFPGNDASHAVKLDYAANYRRA